MLSSQGRAIKPHLVAHVLSLHRSKATGNWNRAQGVVTPIRSSRIKVGKVRRAEVEDICSCYRDIAKVIGTDSACVRPLQKDIHIASSCKGERIRTGDRHTDKIGIVDRRPRARDGSL